MFYQVRPAQLDDWLAQVQAESPAPTAAAIVLDVREPWEREVASVQAQGFELVNIPMGEITSRIGELDSSRPVACLCHHGARSMRVAQFLAQQGFEQVANIAGGIDAWTQERDPSVPRY